MGRLTGACSGFSPELRVQLCVGVANGNYQCMSPLAADGGFDLEEIGAPHERVRPNIDGSVRSDTLSTWSISTAKLSEPLFVYL